MAPVLWVLAVTGVARAWWNATSTHPTSPLPSALTNCSRSGAAVRRLRRHAFAEHARGITTRSCMSGWCTLSRVARNPGKTTMLLGGSALITLAYIAAFAASVEALGGGPRIAVGGAVQLGPALAAAAPTPGGLLRGGRGRRADRCRRGGRSRSIRGAAVPVGYLLAPGGAGLGGRRVLQRRGYA